MQADLKALSRAALLEGSTLLILVGVAVPLKHFAGYSAAVSVMGPVHGVAFLFYCWLLLRTAAAGQWSRGDILRAAMAALIPFGAWFIASRMRTRQTA